MTDQVKNAGDEKPVKRFTSYEEFQKEFYPKSTDQQEQSKLERDSEFGAELALDSLNRHASTLRFGE